MPAPFFPPQKIGALKNTMDRGRCCSTCRKCTAKVETLRGENLQLDDGNRFPGWLGMVNGMFGDGDGIGVMCLGMVYGKVDHFKKEMVYENPGLGGVLFSK